MNQDEKYNQKEPGRHYLSLADAAKERGVSQDYLRFLIFKKKLHGLKIGRNWVTTNEWLDGYLQENGHAKFKQNGSSPKTTDPITSSRHPDQKNFAKPFSLLMRENSMRFFTSSALAVFAVTASLGLGTLAMHAGQNIKSARVLEPLASEEAWLYPDKGVAALVAIQDRLNNMVDLSLAQTSHDLLGVSRDLASISLRASQNFSSAFNSQRFSPQDNLASLLSFFTDPFKSITDSIGLALCKTLYGSCTPTAPIATKPTPAITLSQPAPSTPTFTPPSTRAQAEGSAVEGRTTDITRI
ncbi:MAG: hypothetical protein HY617_00600, partial [Candidatus Sungbacteria bacterium]|nr:hypothetical protein [Candidatus Sungbacteria bacterium]